MQQSRRKDLIPFVKHPPIFFFFFRLFFSLKNASHPQRQEQARIEVENAEDDLVQKTEVAITLMKTVLENVCALLTFVLSLALNASFVARAHQEP